MLTEQFTLFWYLYPNSARKVEYMTWTFGDSL